MIIVCFIFGLLGMVKCAFVGLVVWLGRRWGSDSRTLSVLLEP